MKRSLIYFIAIFIAIFVQNVFAEGAHYAIIVDAGSSGSRLHLFQYQTQNNVPVVADIFTIKTKPGLSSSADHSQLAGASLRGLFDKAVEQLQAKQIDPKTVSVSILATAGMRLLSHEQQQAIYDNVSNYLKTHYLFLIEQVATIPGKMEGVYAWLDVNYLAGNLQPGKTTNGIIDMGGASTQIAFAVKELPPSENTVNLKIAGKSVILFSKSFLGLGLEQARIAMNNASNAANCYPIGYLLNTTANGNYIFPACSGLYENIIKNHHVVEQVSPFSNKNFFAFSGIYHIYHFLHVDHAPDQANVEKNIQKVCTESWDQLQKNYSKIPKSYLSVYCANAAYIDDLLYGTYHLSGSEITVTNKINGSEVDWPLGALLYRLLGEK